MFKIKLFFKSLKCAGRGLADVWSGEQNFRFQVFAGAIVIMIGFLLPTKGWEKLILIILVSLVLITEIINTALEKMSSVLEPRIHPYIREIKDISAAMVLVMVIMVVLAGMVIFAPYLIEVMGY